MGNTTDHSSYFKRKGTKQEKNNEKQKTISKERLPENRLTEDLLPEDLLPDDLTQFILDYDNQNSMEFNLEKHLCDNNEALTEETIITNNTKSIPEEERSKLRPGLRKRNVMKKKVMFDL